MSTTHTITLTWTQYETFGKVLPDFADWYINKVFPTHDFSPLEYVLYNLQDDELEFYWSKWQKEIEPVNSTGVGIRVPIKVTDEGRDYFNKLRDNGEIEIID